MFYTLGCESIQGEASVIFHLSTSGMNVLVALFLYQKCAVIAFYELRMYLFLSYRLIAFTFILESRSFLLSTQRARLLLDFYVMFFFLIV